MKKGFSLIEISIVILIIGIIVAAVVPYAVSMFESAKLSKVRSDLLFISDLLRDHNAKTGKWIVEINQIPVSELPVERRIDPWGNSYSIWNHDVVSISLDNGVFKTVPRSFVPFRNTSLYMIGTASSGQKGIFFSDNCGKSFQLIQSNDFSFEPRVTMCAQNKIYFQGKLPLFVLPQRTLQLFDPYEKTWKDFTDKKVRSAVNCGNILWLGLDSDEVVFTSDGNTFNSFESYTPAKMPTFFMDSTFRNFMVWTIEGNNKLFNIITGAQIADFPNSFQRFVTGSQSVFGFSSSGVYRLDNESAPENIASWSQKRTDNVRQMFILNDLVIFEDNIGVEYASSDNGQTWDQLRDLWGPCVNGDTNPPTHGSLLSVQSSGQEIWVSVASTSPGGYYSLFYSKDNGMSWWLGPEPYQLPNLSNFGFTGSLNSMVILLE